VYDTGSEARKKKKKKQKKQKKKKIIPVLKLEKNQSQLVHGFTSLIEFQ
jgi:hypothetical protein